MSSMVGLSDADWLVMFDQGPTLGQCRRCGGKLERPELPMEIRAFVRLLTRFCRVHVRCSALPFGLDEA